MTFFSSFFFLEMVLFLVFLLAVSVCAAGPLASSYYASLFCASTNDLLNITVNGVQRAATQSSSQDGFSFTMDNPRSCGGITNGSCSYTCRGGSDCTGGSCNTAQGKPLCFFFDPMGSFTPTGQNCTDGSTLWSYDEVGEGAFELCFDAKKGPISYTVLDYFGDSIEYRFLIYKPGSQPNFAPPRECTCGRN